KALPSASAGSTAGDTFTYDALGRMLSDTHADGTAVTYGYGDAGGAHTVTITDENHHQTVQTRMSYGNPDDSSLARVQLPGEPAPTTNTYTYLVDGKLTSVNY